MINREHYGMLWYFLEPSIVSFQKEESDFCLFILRLVILLISETHSEKVTIGSSFCMNFFLYLLLCMNFFSWHFPWHELFFGFLGYTLKVKVYQACVHLRRRNGASLFPWHLWKEVQGSKVTMPTFGILFCMYVKGQTYVTASDLKERFLSFFICSFFFFLPSAFLAFFPFLLPVINPRPPSAGIRSSFYGHPINREPIIFVEFQIYSSTESPDSPRTCPVLEKQ